MTQLHEIAEGVYMVTDYLEQNEISIQAFLITDKHPAIIEVGTAELAREFLTLWRDVVSLDRIGLILVTHEHLDHMGGLAEVFAEAYNAKVMGHINIQGQFVFSGIVGQNIFVKGGEVINLGNRTLRLFHTPLETRGSLSMLLEPDGILFSGDIFGQASPQKWTLTPTLPIDELVKHIKSFHYGLGMDPIEVKRYLTPFTQHTINMIVPSHGSIIQDNARVIIQELIR